MTCEARKDSCHTTTYSRLQFLQCSNAMIGWQICAFFLAVYLLMPVKIVVGPFGASHPSALTIPLHTSCCSPPLDLSQLRGLHILL